MNMKESIRSLAALAVVAVASTAPQAFAVCGNFGGFPIFQCADLAYFDPPPPGSGAVSAVFWQIGYGNATLSTGLPGDSQGTGMSDFTTFNGNDSGLFTPDLVDARALIGDPRVPAGSLCLRNNNWGNAGIDGCCDNVRDPSQPFADDDALNPEFDVEYLINYGYFVPSLDWVQDYPMAVLLTEGSGHYFAVAAVASKDYPDPFAWRSGCYDFKDIVNGNLNPVTGASNVVPWQRVPGDRDPSDPGSGFVAGVTVDPPTGNFVVDLAWRAATLHTDDSSRPSTNPTIANPGMGVGVSDLACSVCTLGWYVVESQPIQDPNDPVGSLDPNGWAPILETADTAAQATVPPETCLRLQTYFARAPQEHIHTVDACRLGGCGDIGYGVTSAPTCIGGPLVAEGVPTDLAASRRRGEVRLSWRTDVEMSVSRFDIVAIKRGVRTTLAEVPCQSCTTGLGGEYAVVIPVRHLRGARTLEVVAVGPNTRASVRIR